jgi:hypothetical protein
LQEPTSPTEPATAYHKPNGLLYDPAEVKAEIEQHVGIASYRKYLLDAKRYRESLALERKKLHYRLRAIEKLLVRNALKSGKIEAFLTTLYEQVHRQVVSRKVAEARKKIFGEVNTK